MQPTFVYSNKLNTKYKIPVKWILISINLVMSDENWCNGVEWRTG